MAYEYTIDGMTCQGCVAKVSQTLSALNDENIVTIQLDHPQARINAAQRPDINRLKTALKTIGDYTIAPVENSTASMSTVATITDEPAPVRLSTYQPLLMIIGFISGVSFLAQYPFTEFSWMIWMRHFMAGFFLVFAFFKLLNLRGFADSYRMYDIIAAKFYGWGLVYPFVELLLGILYLINIFSFETNIATAVILGISSIGVIESNLNKRKIKCACLGDVFNLPMSTVTIIEDLTMVAMAIFMLLTQKGVV